MIDYRERRFKTWLFKKIGKRWHYQNHEDRHAKGVPDTSYGYKGVNGWIEFKSIAKWPSKATSPLKLPHFTGEQRMWLHRRGRKAGNCWLVAEIGEHVFLVAHDNLDGVGKWTKDEWLFGADDWWLKSSFDPVEFLNKLSVTPEVNYLDEEPSP